VKTRHSDVHEAVVAFLRDELERRYLYENVRRFKDLKGIDPEVVAAYREFALRRVYPEGGARAEIEKAFASLRRVLFSPRKMASLGSVAVAAVWYFGSSLPDVVSAGQLVVRTHSCVSAVEKVLAKSLVEKGIVWKSGLKVEDAKTAFADLPAGHVQALTAAVVHLLEITANRETMETGLELLQKIADAMSDKSGPWSDTDRHGIALAMETLREGIALFSMIAVRSIPRFIRGIGAIEKDWEKTLRGEK
jgi:hypothetical protein